MARTTLIGLGFLVLTVVGCETGSSDDNLGDFSTGESAGMPTGITTSDTADDSGGSSGGGPDTNTTDDYPGPNTSTTATTSPTTTTSTSTTTGGATGGAQPPTGMYSDCVAGPEVCTDPTTTTCLQLGAGDGVTACVDGSTCGVGQGCFDGFCGPVDGAFCTNETCTNAAVDCAPSPGANAAICVQNFCALDCTSGTCPTGMTCFDVSIAKICA